jgi:phospholipid transport system substrate-binding protein
MCQTCDVKESTPVRVLLALAFLLFAASAAPASDQPPAALDVIRELHGVYTAVLGEAQALGYRGRYERLAPAVDRAFDSAFMARAVIGRHWKKLSAEEQPRWVATFREFTVANYAARLNRNSGQKFEILEERPGDDGTTMVFSRVVDPGADTIELNYRMRRTDGGWKIIDVYAKGTVSELALRRSEYAAVLSNGGFEKLLETVRAKIADLEAGKGIN